jgi:hypothetical protein
MTLNPYSVLAAFLTVLEAGLGLAVVVLVVRAAMRRRASRRPGHGTANGAHSVNGVDSAPLIAWAAMVLVGLSVVSWPLLYLLLESLVPFWRESGVMCIQGVIRIGSESVGPSAHLPALVAAIQWTKPALVFLAGAWVVLHGADRGTRTSPLAGRLLVVLGTLGMVAVADAGLLLGYLAIPKEERTRNVGCCNVVPAVAEPSRPLPLIDAANPTSAARVLTVIHFALSALLVLGLGVWAFRRAGTARAPRWAAALLAAAVLSVPVGLAFLSSVAAPALLHRPEHRCPYCVLAEAPESVVGIALFVFGAFAVGWAVLAAWGARHPETEPTLGREIRALVLMGLFGYAGAALFAAVGLGVA